MKSLKILSDLDAVGCTTTIVYLNDDGGPDLSQVNRQIGKCTCQLLDVFIFFFCFLRHIFN